MNAVAFILVFILLQPETDLIHEINRIEQDGFYTIFYKVEHPDFQIWKDILQQFKTTAEASFVQVYPQLKMLIIRDKKENIPNLEKVLQTLSATPFQARITARVIETKWTEDFELGLEGDPTAGGALFMKNLPTEAFLREVKVKLNPTSALISPFMGTTFRFYSFDSDIGTIAGIIQMFIERGLAKLQAVPQITVESGKKAVVDLTDEVPIPQQTMPQAGVIITTIVHKKVGTTLEITPYVLSKDLLRLDVRTIFSFIVGKEVVAGITAPIISIREAKTSLVLKNGEEILLGGITREDTVKIRRGIPFLMDIPILGAIFSKHEEEKGKVEIMFHIKVEIIPPVK